MAKIVVCIKPIKMCLFNNDYNEILSISPYDMDALLKALELKKRYGYKVVCLCMGIKSTEDILYKCIAMGADQAILLNDTIFVAADTYITALVLATAIRKIEDTVLVFCGMKSVDGETGQVPVEMASMLNWIYISHVMDVLTLKNNRAELITSDSITIRQIEVEIPFVAISGDISMDQPDVGLLAYKQAREQIITIWNSSDMDFLQNDDLTWGSKTKVIETKSCFIEKNPLIIKGELGMDFASKIDRIISTT